MKRIFVTGIDTNVGKTIVSAILTQALKADYWKPVQSGDLQNTDTMKVKSLVNNPDTVYHPEIYKLSQPLSPHAASEIDRVTINLEDFNLPETENHIIIEGAGGLMVPLNNQCLIADLISHLGVSVVLVSRNYLGSINHTLLTIQELRRRNIPVLGIVFNGEHTPQTEIFIQQYSQLPVLFRVKIEKTINKQTILKYANCIKI
ncbi:MAG: dethiobiotin synthase [Hydrotalea flava]|uniref:dethiobiotin synthase n=1 Tax=Hydrotalea TaxID=1004300 RepID=UPI0010265230|nr:MULTISPECIES: dethiobiotin synthase [Hydrotalea]MBY0347632.1 dethiobiotin synthase [Hydrotalea flava]NIM35121.1 dethiobiotin synthase [Hydrotalea flava]NIM37947.1 dethiobiotin synthase [Hydrotalea flava]NIN03116.1 dethiobiotin synthase [Hydrotalea flava]NIN14801.1 dethiobiotin synthase [Hydrotalea flava]